LDHTTIAAIAPPGVGPGAAGSLTGFAAGSASARILAGRLVGSESALSVL